MITHFLIEPSVLGFITALLVVLISTPSLIRISFLKNLVDSPDNERKLHAKVVPTLGGVVIFAGTIFASMLWFPDELSAHQMVLKFSIHYFKHIVACAFILFFVGLKDDLFGTAPMKKLIAHLMVAFILVLMADIRITGLKGILGIYEIPYWASILLSVFTYTLIVNAINFIDGIDGLAGGVGFIISLAFGLWFAYAGGYVSSLLGFSLAGALLGFLYFNFSPAKIFMGDSGSLFVGLILSVLSIQLIEYRATMLPSFMLSISKPVFVLSCLSYPLLDTLRVIAIRVYKKKSPFSADRNHLHHRFQDLGFSHAWTSLMIYGYTVAMIIICTQIRFNPSASLVTMIFISVSILSLPFFFKTKKNHLNIVKPLLEKDTHAKKANHF